MSEKFSLIKYLDSLQFLVGTQLQFLPNYGIVIYIEVIAAKKSRPFCN